MQPIGNMKSQRDAACCMVRAVAWHELCYLAMEQSECIANVNLRQRNPTGVPGDGIGVPSGPSTIGPSRRAASGSSSLKATEQGEGSVMTDHYAINIS